MPQASESVQVPYQVVTEWAIPNGGFGRTVVVDPKFRNEVDLRQLAESLRLDTIHDRNAFIYIYDDKDAVPLRDAAFKDFSGEGDLPSHDSHLIGFYFRNIMTGYHALIIAIDGVAGEQKSFPL